MTGAPIPHSPHAARRIRVRLAFLTVVLGIVFAATYGAGNYPHHVAGLADWWAPTVAAANSATMGCVAAAIVRRSPTYITRASAGFAVSYAATYVLWFAAWDGRTVPDAVATWLSGLSLVAAIAAALAWRMSTALLYTTFITALTRGMHFITVGPVSPRYVAVALAGNLLLSLVVAALTRVAIDSATTLDTTWGENHVNAARDAAEHARQAERGRVADLLHDFVLAALLAAARQPDSAPVRDEARRALQRMDGYSDQSPPSVSAGVALRRISDGCDVAVGVRVITHAQVSRDTEYPAPVVDAFADGAREAVRNSYRHAGPDVDVVATIYANPDQLIVTLADDGPGIDASPSGRYGLTRLRERFDSLPDAELRLDARGGTTISMSWTRQLTPSVVPRTDFRELLGITEVQIWTAVAAFFLGVLVCGAAYTGDATPVWAGVVGIVLAWIATVALFHPRADPLPLMPALFVACVVPGVELLLITTSVAPMLSSVLGPGYLAAPFTLVLGLRGRSWAAAILTAACATIPLAFTHRTGLSTDYWLGEAGTWSVGLLLTVFFARTIRPLMSNIRRLQAESSARHADAAASAAVEAYRVRHLALLESRARPLLVDIANGALSAEHQQRAAAITEAQLRASLRAPGLAHRVLDAGVTRARLRGVHVVLIDDSTAESFRDQSAFDRFACAAVAELDAAPPTRTITIRLTPIHAESRATLVSTDGPDTVRRLRFDSDGITGQVFIDDESGYQDE